MDENNSTQQPESPERRRFDNGADNVLMHELGHTKSPIFQWITVYVIIAASILGAFSIIAGEWWMAWLAIAITVAACIYCWVSAQATKRSEAGKNPAAERESVPDVRASANTTRGR